MGNLDDLKRLLAFSSRFVQSVTLVQLPSHLELDILFDGLGKCVCPSASYPSVALPSGTLLFASIQHIIL